MATTKGRNYSILVGIKLDTSDVQKQLDAIKGREIKVKVDVEGNENVAQLDYDESRQEFDMVFYFDGLFSKLDKKIYNLSQEMGIEFEPDEVWEISYDIENSEEYNDMITSVVKEKSKNMGREI